MSLRQNNGGFTVIELLVVAIVVGVLSTLVITTYSGVQAKNRNSDRQTNIDTLQGQLETYYAQFSTYPTLANINDGTWRKTNLKEVSGRSLQDPQWSKTNKACTSNAVAVVSTTPVEDCYAYQVTTSDGSACDNDKAMCAQYTLTAMLEGGGKYVKSSLN